MSSLAQRVVLITGASSGIGEHLARELARRGAKVGLLARREDRLETLARALRDDGAAAGWAEADVTDGPGLAAALDGLEAELGPADVVVANAGFGRPEAPGAFKPGRAAGIYDVNLLGALHTIDWALPRFLERRAGHLVGVASVAAFFGFPDHAAYCGSKAALRVHLQSLRLSLRRHGIAVTTICPGFVESELTAKNRFPMPFLWPTDRAARKIADAIAHRRGEVVFPWQMRCALGLLTRLPTGLAEALAGRLPGG
ncbi:MAG: SDR family NAD(P)-dependent oxidoreductase [Acidobacteria bacterium]|nr:SDR family NAD(P)-dependent oxidoreductase [Acidobacteriota bacterium]